MNPRLSIGSKPDEASSTLQNRKKLTTKAATSNLTGASNKQTFAKVPPKRNAYKPGQNGKKDDAASQQALSSSNKVYNRNSGKNNNGRNSQQANLQGASGSAGGPAKNSGENQLLYKIKYINPTVSSAANQKPSKKNNASAKGAKAGGPASAQAAPGSQSNRSRPQTANARGKAASNHAQSQQNEDAYRPGGRQTNQLQEDAQSQRLKTEVLQANADFN